MPVVRIKPTVRITSAGIESFENKSVDIDATSTTVGSVTVSN